MARKKKRCETCGSWRAIAGLAQSGLCDNRIDNKFNVIINKNCVCQNWDDKAETHKWTLAAVMDEGE